MKKLFLIALVLLFAVNFTQARTSDVTKKQVTHEYKGVVKINGTEVVDGKILVDNAFKQHTLYKKAKQWADTTYERGTAMLVAKNEFTVIAENYRLQLKFKDGIFEFSFTDDGKFDQKKEDLIIENLTNYVKTCKLIDKSW